MAVALGLLSLTLLVVPMKPLTLEPSEPAKNMACGRSLPLTSYKAAISACMRAVSQGQLAVICMSSRPNMQSQCRHLCSRKGVVGVDHRSSIPSMQCRHQCSQDAYDAMARAVRAMIVYDEAISASDDVVASGSCIGSLKLDAGHDICYDDARNGWEDEVAR